MPRNSLLQNHKGHGMLNKVKSVFPCSYYLYLVYYLVYYLV